MALTPPSFSRLRHLKSILRPFKKNLEQGKKSAIVTLSNLETRMAAVSCPFGSVLEPSEC